MCVYTQIYICIYRSILCVCACITIIKDIEAVNMRENKAYMRRVGGGKEEEAKDVIKF